MSSVLQVYQEEFGTVRGHFGPVNAVAFHPDGRRYEAQCHASQFHLQLHMSCHVQQGQKV